MGFLSDVSAKCSSSLIIIMVRMDLRASQFDIQGDRACGFEVESEVGRILLISSYIRYGTREERNLFVGIDEFPRGKTAWLAGLNSKGHLPL